MAVRSLDWYCRAVGKDGDDGEGRPVNFTEYQKSVDTLRVAYGVLARQRECLGALALALEAISELHPLYNLGADLRNVIAAEIIRNVDTITNLSGVVRSGDL